MALDPRAAARALQGARIAFGVGILVAPRLVGGSWVGARDVTPGATVIARALGVRDALLGALALHTLDNEQVGPRYLAALAVADAVDAAAVFAALPQLPRARGLAGIALAGTASATGFALSRALKQRSPLPPA